MAIVAPGSLAILAAAVMWVSAHDPRAADVPTVSIGPTTAASTAALAVAAGTGDDVSTGMDTATATRLARLQVLLGQAEARLALLDQGAGSPGQPVSPGQADAAPPAPAVQPSIASTSAPAAHATTGASGA